MFKNVLVTASDLLPLTPTNVPLSLNRGPVWSAGKPVRLTSSSRSELRQGTAPKLPCSQIILEQFCTLRHYSSMIECVHSQLVNLLLGINTALLSLLPSRLQKCHATEQHDVATTVITHLCLCCVVPLPIYNDIVLPSGSK